MAMVHGVFEDRLHESVVEPLPREVHPYWGLLTLALIFIVGIASGLGWAATRPQFHNQVTGTVGSAHELLRDEKREIAFTTDQVIAFNTGQKDIIVPYETKTPVAKGEVLTVTFNPADPHEYSVYDTKLFGRVLQVIAVLALLLGGLGAYLRFVLALALNARRPQFPLGTFAANVAGTWLFAAASAVARFGVHYDDKAALSLLYGVDIGFCGCLTTVSTWVGELRGLPRRAAYVYAAATLAAAAVGPALFVEAYSGFIAAKVAADLQAPPLDFCGAYAAVCAAALSRLGCPPGAAVVRACGDGAPSLAAFAGACACGAFDASAHAAEALVDSQVAGNISASLVAVWPSALADAASDPASVVDACLSFDNACDHLLNRLGCPPALRSLNACNRAGLPGYAGECGCGGMRAGSARVGELLVDHLVRRREDLLPYSAGPAAGAVDFCAAFADVCARMLDHVQCPLAQRAAVGCANGSDIGSWVGACSCYGGAYGVAAARVAETLVAALVRPRAFALVRAAANDSAPAGAIDACATFEATCGYFLDAIACPASFRRNAGCADGRGGSACAAGNCSVANWVGACACAPPGAPPGAGLRAQPAAAIADSIFDVVAAPEVARLTFFPPSAAPFSLIAASNPFRPLLAFRYPLPTQ